MICGVFNIEKIEKGYVIASVVARGSLSCKCLHTFNINLILYSASSPHSLIAFVLNYISV